MSAIHFPVVDTDEQEYKFEYWFHTDQGWCGPEKVKFPADIYIVMQDVFGCEDFAMEMLAWCEEANPGDKFEDEDVRVVAL